jgi:predicted TIM-barrel fold metal-dependent hydrolase
MIIDFHTHIFPPFIRKERERFFSKEPAFEMLYQSQKARLIGREDLIEKMDQTEVDKSVVFGFPWQESDLFRRHNDYIIESVHLHPDRLIGLCCFSPLSASGPRETERCIKSGLAGVGELATYHDEFSSCIGPLKEVMELCSQNEAIILLHTNEPVGHIYPGKAPMNLRDIYSLLKEYRSNRIVLAHWGGGIFFYALMKKEVGELFSHVWFDTAASPYLYRMEIYRTAGEIIGYDKILFGSDYPLLGPDRYFHEMASLNLPAETTEMIKGKNAQKLLGLS